MYLAFFGLREKPFNLTPDPKFLYLNPSYREALAALRYGVAHRKGFVSLIGEAGTGKTTLLRCLLAELEPDVRSVLVLNPAVGFDELLTFILTDLGRPPLPNTPKLELLQALNAELLQTLGRGGNVVVLIDEAQDLAIPVLEELRLLSNLETANEKILQFVLSGQPELDGMLARRELRQLRQRIAVPARLRPLRWREIAAYVSSRVQIAGGDPRGLFTRGALVRLWWFSHGVPRLVNVACDNALVTAYAAGQRQVSWKIMRETARDLRRIEQRGPLSGLFRRGRLATIAAAAVIGSVIGLGVSRFGGELPSLQLVFAPAAKRDARPAAVERRDDSPLPRGAPARGAGADANPAAMPAGDALAPAASDLRVEPAVEHAAPALNEGQDPAGAAAAVVANGSAAAEAPEPAIAAPAERADEALPAAVAPAETAKAVQVAAAPAADVPARVEGAPANGATAGGGDAGVAIPAGNDSASAAAQPPHHDATAAGASRAGDTAPDGTDRASAAAGPAAPDAATGSESARAGAAAVAANDSASAAAGTAAHEVAPPAEQAPAAADTALHVVADQLAPDTVRADAAVVAAPPAPDTGAVAVAEAPRPDVRPPDVASLPVADAGAAPRAPADVAPQVAALTPPEADAAAPARLGIGPVEVRIEKGDDLTHIARRYYGYDSRLLLEEIRRANPSIVNLDIIPVGQLLVLPPDPFARDGTPRPDEAAR